MYRLYTKLLSFTHILTSSAVQVPFTNSYTLEHCLSARGLKLVYFLHTSDLRSLYKFFSLIDNTPKQCLIYRSSRLAYF